MRFLCFLAGIGVVAFVVFLYKIARHDTQSRRNDHPKDRS